MVGMHDDSIGSGQTDPGGPQAPQADGDSKAGARDRSLSGQTTRHVAPTGPVHCPGEVVDARYEILAVLGAGGMGQVYRARDLRLQRMVALKRLHMGAAMDATLRERFDREARAIAALSHQGVVALHDYGADDQGPYLAMEYLEGEDLHQVVKRDGPLPTDMVRSIALQICDALAYIHGRGLVHRDIKPSNVYRLPDGRVKLLDFGLVTGTAGDSMHTRAGEGIGTVDFMPPEQAADAGSVDARADLFALGATLTYLVSGRPPRYVKAEELPFELRGVLGRLGEFDPARRPASAAATAAELSEGPRIASNARADASQSSVPCVHCSAVNPLSSTYCTGCGKRMHHECPSCGAPDVARDKHCVQCGVDLRSFKQAMALVFKAEQSINALRWDDARAALVQALSVHSELPATQVVVRQIDTAMAKVEAGLREAQLAIKGEDLLALEAAAALLEAWLPPEDPKLRQIVQQHLPAVRRAAQARAATVQQHESLAHRAEQAGEWDKAAEAWRFVCQVQPAHRNAEESLRSALDRHALVRRLLFEGKEQAQARQLAELLKTRELLRLHLPDDNPSMRVFLAETCDPLIALHARVQELQVQATGLAGDAELEQARSVLRMALEAWPEHDECSGLLAEVETRMATHARHHKQGIAAWERADLDALRRATALCRQAWHRNPLNADLQDKQRRLEAKAARQLKLVASILLAALVAGVAGWYWLGVAQPKGRLEAWIAAQVAPRMTLVDEALGARRLAAARAALVDLDRILGADSASTALDQARLPGWLPWSTAAGAQVVSALQPSLGRIALLRAKLDEQEREKRSLLDDAAKAIAKGVGVVDRTALARLAKRVGEVDPDSDEAHQLEALVERLQSTVSKVQEQLVDLRGALDAKDLAKARSAAESIEGLQREWMPGAIPEFIAMRGVRKEAWLFPPEPLLAQYAALRKKLDEGEERFERLCRERPFDAKAMQEALTQLGDLGADASGLEQKRQRAAGFQERVKVLEERLNEAMAQLAKADAQAAGEILGQFSAEDRLHPGWTQVDADLQLARRSMEESKQGMQAAIQARDTAGVRSAAAAFLRAQASGEEARRIGASRDEYEAGLAAAIGEAWNSCKQALDGNQVQQFDDRFAQLQSMLAGAPIGNYVKNAKLEELIEYRQSRGKSNKLEDLVARLESALVSPSAGGILIDGLLAELEKLAPADARLDGLRRRAKARADELCAKRVESWAEVLDLAPKPGIVKDEAARAAIVAAQLPWRVRHKRTGIVMLLVPAMRGLEKPFYLAQAELTWGQWYEKLGAVAPYEPSDAKPWDWSIDDIKMRFKAKSDADDYRFGAKWKLDPVWRADPAESARVLKRMDLRLPTHEEWLVAAFGSTGQAPQNLPQIARYKNTSAQIGLDDARRHMPEAKELPLNVMGFTNILGNVWELLADGRFIGGASNSTQSEVLDGAARRLDGGWRGIRPAYTPD